MAGRFRVIAAGHVVRHGARTRLLRADYFVNLRGRRRAHIEAGADILEQFAARAGRNAQAVFAEMEFE